MVVRIGLGIGLSFMPGAGPSGPASAPVNVTPPQEVDFLLSEGVSWLNMDTELAAVPDGNAVTVSDVSGLPFEIMPAGAPIYRGLLVGPSAGWNGTGGSGYGGVNPAAPIDPPRDTAKPVCRNIEVPGQWFDDDLVQGCIAGAAGGVRVYYWSEGTRTEIPLSTRVWPDVNGKQRKLVGYWVTLDHSAYIAKNAAGGESQNYWEVTPNDPTMQKIVRPVDKFWARPAGQLYEDDITFGTGLPTVAGVSYPTLSAALTYVRANSRNNVRLTCMTSDLYDMVVTGGNPQGVNGGFVKIRAAPGVTCTLGKSSLAPTDSAAMLRPVLDSLHLEGKGVVLDYAWTGVFYAENATRWHWFDGCRFTNSRGLYSYWRKGLRPALVRYTDQTNGEGGIAHYFTEVDCDNVAEPFYGHALVRNCTSDYTYADIFTRVRCAVGNRITNYGNEFWQQEIGAFSVTYSGASATATIEKSGANGAAGGSIKLTDSVNGVKTIELPITDGASNYNVSEVVAAINANAGWIATPSANADWNDRQASRLTKAGNAAGSFGAFAPLSAKDTVVAMVTAFDIHGDAYQEVVQQTNVAIVGNTVLGFNQAQPWLLDGTGSKDILIANNVINGVAGNLKAQLARAHSHLMIWGNVVPAAPFLARSAFTCDAYSSVKNNVLRSFTWEGAIDADLAVENNHLLIGPIPSGAVGTSTGGALADLWADAANNDFTPAGLLLTNLVPPILPFDDRGARRPGLGPKGARAERFLGGVLTRDEAASLLAISPSLPVGPAGAASLQWKKAPLDSGDFNTLTLAFGA